MEDDRASMRFFGRGSGLGSRTLARPFRRRFLLSKTPCPQDFRKCDSRYSAAFQLRCRVGEGGRRVLYLGPWTLNQWGISDCGGCCRESITQATAPPLFFRKNRPSRDLQRPQYRQLLSTAKSSAISVRWVRCSASVSSADEIITAVLHFRCHRLAQASIIIPIIIFPPTA